MSYVIEAFLFAVLITNPAHPLPPATGDDTDVTLMGVETSDQIRPSNGGASEVSSSGHVYSYQLHCGLGGLYICRAPEQCSANGMDGYLYDVQRDGLPLGTTCITEAEAEQQAVITPGQVLRAFRSLEWPSSELIVQPAGGETLVNFATNFLTDNDQPRRQSVTLLGRRVTIEATPTTYTWLFGDGESVGTDRPGSAYPALDITHDYRSAGPVGASVDTTYTGRFRIGGGPWTAIPESLTVTGAAETILVREARPTLVAP